MQNNQVSSIILSACILFLAESCVTWRAPRSALYKGIHQLPSSQNAEAIALKASDSNDGLARVVVLPFTNQTKSKSYDYLAESLSSAIDAGMASRFEYKRAVIDTQKEFVMRLHATENRRQLIEEFSKQHNLDIVIAGYFASQGSRQILIQTEIYDKKSANNFAEFGEQSKIDSSLFTVSDAIAQRTVDAILRANR